MIKSSVVSGLLSGPPGSPRGDQEEELLDAIPGLNLGQEGGSVFNEVRGE